MTFIMLFFFPGMQRCRSCAKGIIWNKLLCWCKINAVKLFPQRLPLYSQAAGSVQACVFVSWHSRVPYMHCHTHTHGMNLCIILSCLLQSCGTAASRFLHTHTHTKGNILRHKYWINSAEKKGGRQIAKRKRTAEREMASCLTWKERGCTPTRMRGPIDLQLPFQMISRCLKLIGFLESAGEESCRAALTPADLEASAAWPGHPGCAPWASVMQSILVRRQTTDVASCWLHLTQRPLTSTTTRSRRRGEARNVKRKVKDTSTYTNRDINMYTSTRGDSKSHTCSEKSQTTDQHSWRPFKTSSRSSCDKDKSNWPAPAKPDNAIET